MLGVNADSMPIVSFQDLKEGAIIREITCFAAGWIPTDVSIVPDMSGDGIPDISVAATNAEGTEGKTQIYNSTLTTGGLIKETPLP